MEEGATLLGRAIAEKVRQCVVSVCARVSIRARGEGRKGGHGEWRRSEFDQISHKSFVRSVE